MNIFGLFQNFAQENTRDVNKDANTSTDTGLGTENLDRTYDDTIEEESAREGN